MPKNKARQHWIQIPVLQHTSAVTLSNTRNAHGLRSLNFKMRVMKMYNNFVKVKLDQYIKSLP